MKKNSIWGIWLALGLLAACLIVIPTVGSIIIIGNRLATIHPGLDVGLYIVMVMLLYILAIRPIALVLFSPNISLRQLSGLPYNKKMRLAKRLAANQLLSSEIRQPLLGAIYRKELLDEPLLTFISQLDETALQKIDDKASLAFVSNTIVQNGRLEAVALLSINIRLVHDLVNHYGFRPSLASLLHIYGEVFVTAFLVDEVGELDLDSALSVCLSPAISAIPGFHLITHSLIQGATSSLFTLRVGLITREILKEGLEASGSRQARRTQANREAASRATVIFPQVLGKLKDALMQRFNPVG